MVAGRFINVYATNDWTLGIAFRARYITYIPLFQFLFSSPNNTNLFF